LVFTATPDGQAMTRTETVDNRAESSRAEARPAGDIPAKADSPALFDRISPRYDLLNHLLSLGLDIRWRGRVARLLQQTRHEVVLDLACGTCDQLLAVVRRNTGTRFALGVDLADRMMRIGAAKIARQQLSDRAGLSKGDGMALPVASGSVDCATIAFGIRNMPEPRRCLGEFLRVLRPGGTVAILEFSLPANALVRAVYLAYFRWVLPWVGALISGDRRAYRYLNRTVEGFPYGEQFGKMLGEAGFDQLKMIPLTCGIATIYLGTKPGSRSDA